MNEVFEEILVHCGNYYCTWGFKFKKQVFSGCIKVKGTIKEVQIKAIEDMLDIMKRVH